MIEKNRAVAQFFMDRAKRPFDPEKIAQTFPHSPNDWLYICAALIKGDFLNNKEQDALFVMHEEELVRRREKEKYVVFATNPKDDGVMADFLRWVEARRSKQGLREGLSDLLVKTAKPRKI